MNEDDEENQYPDAYNEGYQQPAVQTLYDIDEEENPPPEFDEKEKQLEMSPNIVEQTQLAQASTAQTEKLLDYDHAMIVDQQATTMIDTTEPRPKEFNAGQGQFDEE